MGNCFKPTESGAKKEANKSTDTNITFPCPKIEEIGYLPCRSQVFDL